MSRNACTDFALGYPISRYLVPIFNPDECVDRDPQVQAARKRWNRGYSSMRIVVEHAFGRLKARFPFLQGMRGWDIDNMYRVVESLLVVHNILLTLDDRADDIEGARAMLLELQAQHDERRNERDFQPSVNVAMRSNDVRQIGLERRRQLVEYYSQNIVDA